MKLAVSNLAWNIDEEDAAAAILKQRGVKYIEIAPTKKWPDPKQASPQDIAAYKRYWNDQGLQIVALQSLLFGHPELTLFESPQARAKSLDYLRFMIALAHGLGAGILVYGSPKNRQRGQLTMADAMPVARDFFAELGRAAEEAGVVFCIEPNAPQYACDFVSTAAEGEELVKQVASPGFGLHLDSACMAMAGDSPKAIETLHPKHFHISAPNLGPVAEGVLPYDGFAAALRQIGYTGYVSIEMKPEATGNLERTATAVDTSLKFFAD